MEESKQLKNAGLKITLPRLKVLQILEQSPNHHLSAEGVYKALLETGEDVGLATVYRVLTQFEAAGLVTRHNFEGGHSVFELSQGLIMIIWFASNVVVLKNLLMKSLNKDKKQ